MRTLARLQDATIHAFAVLAGIVFVLITLVLVLNVGLRFFAGKNVYGMIDAIEMGLMAATFLGAPWVLRKNAHVSVDIVLSGLSPARRLLVDRLTSLLGALLSALFTWATLSALMIALSRGSMMRGVLVIPEWVPLLAPFIGGLLLTLEFLRRAAVGPETEAHQAGL
ncbi:TRAP transporter small permease [Georhizobium profundi]|uniref:TRAP transporter small permease protein n=1 Tax=Georhizobium profundi TaxID=2341112 RepID=A0A3Q8XMT7_9HYPH|nr:TRAP transporter small permease [Georhizobium profundi]AZN71233.1 TRAP transporter small permease [Georhizobium profundi]